MSEGFIIGLDAEIVLIVYKGSISKLRLFLDRNLKRSSSFKKDNDKAQITGVYISYAIRTAGYWDGSSYDNHHDNSGAIGFKAKPIAKGLLATKEQLVEIADLVTDLEKVKKYYHPEDEELTLLPPKL